jgi:phage terminase small subunit
MAPPLELPDDFGLNPQQVRFCREFIHDLNQTKAYIRAGYSAMGAATGASELMKDPRVASCIASLESQCCSAADVSPTFVLRELKRLAGVDTDSMFKPDGNLKLPCEWTKDQSACVQSFDVVSRNLTAGDGSTDMILKVRMYDKTKALDTLAKHLNLMTEKVEHQGAIVIKWQD